MTERQNYPKAMRKGVKRSFQGSKRAEKEKNPCNIMQKFIPEQQTMTVHTSKNPAI